MSDQDRQEKDGNRALVAEYVLGLLDVQAHEAVGKRIADDTALRREHDFWANHFSGLDDQFEPVAPPAHILPKIESRLFGTEKGASWWDSLALWRSVAAGALAVAVTAVGFSVMQPSPDSSALATQLVAALQAEGVERFVCLGDVAAVGPQPREVVQRLQQLSCPVVMGNTDAYVLDPPLNAA